MHIKGKLSKDFLPGIFQIMVGFGMLGIWLSLCLTGRIPELQTEILGISAHLLAEAVTALILLFSGFHILLKGRKHNAVFHISSGTLIYTLIASPGYYAQKGQWGTASLFLVLLAFTVAFLLSRDSRDQNQLNSEL